MRIYYVIPPQGMHQYSSQADAQAAFESGEVWKCTGWAEVDEVTRKIQGMQRYQIPVPARYTQGDMIKVDEETSINVPRTWALQWKPGRVSFLKFKVYQGQRKVSLNYGPGQGKSLLKEQAKPRHEDVLQHSKEFKKLANRILRGECIGTTGSGLQFQLTKDGPQWLPSGLTGPVRFDPDVSDEPWKPGMPRMGEAKTVGDWVLERYYMGRKAAAGFFSEDNYMYETVFHYRRGSSDDILDKVVHYPT